MSQGILRLYQDKSLISIILSSWDSVPVEIIEKALGLLGCMELKAIPSWAISLFLSKKNKKLTALV